MYNMSMVSDEAIEHLKSNPFFQEFLNHVYECVGAMDTVVGLDDMSNTEAGEAVRVRAKALSVVQDILSPVISFRNKKELTKEDLKEEGKKYGLS